LPGIAPVAVALHPVQLLVVSAVVLLPIVAVALVPVAILVAAVNVPISIGYYIVGLSRWAAFSAGPVLATLQIAVVVAWPVVAIAWPGFGPCATCTWPCIVAGSASTWPVAGSVVVAYTGPVVVNIVAIAIAYVDGVATTAADVNIIVVTTTYAWSTPAATYRGPAPSTHGWSAAYTYYYNGRTKHGWSKKANPHTHTHTHSNAYPHATHAPKHIDPKAKAHAPAPPGVPAEAKTPNHGRREKKHGTHPWAHHPTGTIYNSGPLHKGLGISLGITGYHMVRVPFINMHMLRIVGLAIGGNITYLFRPFITYYPGAGGTVRHKPNAIIQCKKATIGLKNSSGRIYSQLHRSAFDGFKNRRPIVYHIQFGIFAIYFGRLRNHGIQHRFLCLVGSGYIGQHIALFRFKRNFGKIGG
jgi:hypothetical protein